MPKLRIFYVENMSFSSFCENKILEKNFRIYSVMGIISKKKTVTQRLIRIFNPACCKDKEDLT